MKSPGSIKVIVDRIEGDLAVLVLYDDDRVKFNLPVSYLPDGTSEGDHIQMSFTKDDLSRESEKKRIDNLLGELKAR
jgi:hypothetical protein